MHLLGMVILICICIIVVVVVIVIILISPLTFAIKALTNRNQFRGTKKVLQSRGIGRFATWMHTYSENPTVSMEFGGMSGVPSFVSRKQTHFENGKAKGCEQLNDLIYVR